MRIKTRNLSTPFNLQESSRYFHFIFLLGETEQILLIPTLEITPWIVTVWLEGEKMDLHYHIKSSCHVMAPCFCKRWGMEELFLVGEAFVINRFAQKTLWKPHRTWKDDSIPYNLRIPLRRQYLTL